MLLYSATRREDPCRWAKSSRCLKINASDHSAQEVRKKTANTKESRGKELKVKPKLIDTETTAKDIINKAKNCFFEKISKIDKPTVNWIEQKIKKTGTRKKITFQI